MYFLPPRLCNAADFVHQEDCKKAANISQSSHERVFRMIEMDQWKLRNPSGSISERLTATGSFFGQRPKHRVSGEIPPSHWPLQIHNSAVLLKCASLCCYMLLYMEHLQICSSEICTEIFKFTSLCEKKILRMEVVPNLECKKIPHTPELPKTLHSLLTMAFQQAWEWQFKRNGNYPIVLSEDIFGRMFGAVAKIAASKKQRKLPWSTPQWLHDASSAHHGNIHVDFQE